MNHPDYNSPAELKNELEKNGFSMQKKFGQNFLINENARKKIIDALDINDSSIVWEVGPGLGAMTNEILERGAELTVFEIDRGFISLIKEYFKEYEEKNKFSIIEGDVLKTWKNHLKQSQIPDRFFGNLPYNVAATIIADTIENNVRFDKCVFTVQKEVALRMTAKSGTNDYSSFSVLCQWAYDLQPLMDLNGNNFWPRPNVDSRSVIFTKKENFPCCENPKLFMKVMRSLFSSRRKTVRNNLQGYLTNNELTIKFLEDAQIDPMKRAEVLTLEEMLRLSDVINRGKK
ncbi:MAG: ribosomal RNA small subunit methyltransferase A [Treponema sp.]|nr:ribosomal RNA small subunit methyltransferase A [Treponema sp.]